MATHRAMRSGRASRGAIVLLALLIALGVLLTWRSWPKRDADRHVAAVLKHQEKLIAPTTVLETPDYLDEPKFSTRGEPASVGEEHYQSARQALSRVQQLKTERAKQLSPKPYTVPELPQAVTEQQFQDRYYRYRLRELETYQRHTADQGAARTAGEIYLQAYLKYGCQRSDAPEFSQLCKLAEAAIESGSRDPIVRAYAAYHRYQSTGDLAAAEQVWMEVLPEFPKTNYPRIVPMFVRFLAFEAAREVKPEVVNLRTEALAVAIVRWLEAETADPQWMDCVFDRLLAMWYDDSGLLKLQILVGCFNSPRVDPAIVHTLMGDWYLRRGWSIRGSGMADEVKPESWKPFNEHMDKASAHLQYAWSLRPEIHVAPRLMITVCKAGFDDQYRPYDWFLRSLEARFDHWPTYTALLDALRPRWGGSLPEMIDFAQRCLETDRFDTMVPYALLDILPDMQSMELEGNPQRLAELEVQPLLHQFLNRRARYRESHVDAVLFGDSRYYRTRLGLLLDQFDRPAEAVAEFRAADGDFDLSLLQADNRPGRHLLRRLFAAQGEVRDRVLSFDGQFRARWPADTPVEVFSMLESELQALRPFATEELAKRYYEHAARAIQQLQAYARGEWVALDFADGALGWELCSDGFHEVPGENAVVIGRWSVAIPHVWARPLAHFSPPFHVEAVVEQHDVKRPFSTFGLQWTREGRLLDAERVETEPFVGVVAMTSRAVPEISEFASYSSTYARAVDQTFLRGGKVGPRKLSWRLWPQSFEAIVDRTWRTVHLSQPINPGGVLSLGEPFERLARRSLDDGGGIKISGVRIKKLSVPEPPTDSAEIDERDEYWAMRVAADPDDAIAALKLCTVRLDQRRLDEAWSVVQQLQQRWPRLDGVHRLAGRVLFLQRRYREAVTELLRAMEEPTKDDFMVSCTLAEIYAAAPDEGLRNAEYALSLTESWMNSSKGNDPIVPAAAAAAHAEAGHFEQARETNLKAIGIATDEEFKAELHQRQLLYEADKPFRLPAVESSN